MNKEQQHSPKYWVVHDIESYDVFPRTMNKNRIRAIDKFIEIHGFDRDWWETQTEFVCSLIEIKLVEV